MLDLPRPPRIQLLRLLFNLVRFEWSAFRTRWALARVRLLTKGSFAVNLLPPRWSAALDPQRAYRPESTPPPFGYCYDAHLSSILYAATKHSQDPSGPVAPINLNGPSSPIDAHLATPRWEIGVDEPLTATHPCLALAYLARLEAAEHDGPQSVALAAHALARDISGRGHPGDSLDPDILRGFESSSFARSRLPRILRATPPLIERAREAFELSVAADAARALSRTAPRI